MNIVTVVFSQTKNDTKNVITMNLGLSGDGGYHQNSTYLTIDFGIYFVILYILFYTIFKSLMLYLYFYINLLFFIDANNTL
jgi:hypothetical protein